ncbi:unnamed protein product [Soboliphyme baturini]|uniref:Uncharacterized protein n=1 Tax=Soboliphyme baturini TaxID=241478 RepID=A0A3P8EV90_9BILA|nr:unnamed protein product [Soboliphyme baturini]
MAAASTRPNAAGNGKESSLCSRSQDGREKHASVTVGSRHSASQVPATQSCHERERHHLSACCATTTDRSRVIRENPSWQGGREEGTVPTSRWPPAYALKRVIGQDSLRVTKERRNDGTIETSGTGRAASVCTAVYCSLQYTGGGLTVRGKRQGRRFRSVATAQDECDCQRQAERTTAT